MKLVAAAGVVIATPTLALELAAIGGWLRFLVAVVLAGAAIAIVLATRVEPLEPRPPEHPCPRCHAGELHRAEGGGWFDVRPWRCDLCDYWVHAALCIDPEEGTLDCCCGLEEALESGQTSQPPRLPRPGACSS